MRLPNSAHTERPWRIHELTPDFEVEDVWALATPGGPGELPRLVTQIGSDNFPDGAPVVVRFLWEARWKIGALLRWDAPGAGFDSRVTSLRGRLPSDLRDAPSGPEMSPVSTASHATRLPHGEFVELHQPLGGTDPDGRSVRPLEYRGTPVPKKVNRLGAAGPPVPGPQRKDLAVRPGLTP